MKNKENKENKEIKEKNNLLIIKLIFRSICFFIFLIIIIFTIPALIETNKVDKKIKNFINKGIYNKELSTDKTQIFLVPRGTNQKQSINLIDDKYYLGSDGDIIVSNYLDFVKNIPVISELADFYIGGHASIVFDKYRYESIGYGEKTGVNEIENNIFDLNLNEYIGLRLNINDEEIEKAKTFVLNQVGKSYNNYYFFNNKDHFYCTDLVTRAFGREALLNYKINHDGFLVTTHDILYSDLTEIFFYYKKEQGISKYYLIN